MCVPVIDRYTCTNHSSDVDLSPISFSENGIGDTVGASASDRKVVLQNLDTMSTHCYCIIFRLVHHGVTSVFLS